MPLETEKILGYPVTLGDLDSHLNIIEEWLNGSDRAHNFICANPHSLVVAGNDPEFSRAIHQADLVTPDGVGIVLASRLLAGSIRERVTGTDIFLGLNQKLNEQGGVNCFFLGSAPATLEKIVARMHKDFPNLCVAGTYSPPFKTEFNEEDNEVMINTINQAKPDILWVGMTAPKQEKWIYANRNQLEVKFIGAVGALFDFYAGNVKRSHPIFQHLGLEWLPRLLQEPRRLWRRNFISSPIFLFKVFKHKFSDR